MSQHTYIHTYTHTNRGFLGCLEILSDLITWTISTSFCSTSQLLHYLSPNIYMASHLTSPWHLSQHLHFISPNLSITSLPISSLPVSQPLHGLSPYLSIAFLPGLHGPSLNLYIASIPTALWPLTQPLHGLAPNISILEEYIFINIFFIRALSALKTLIKYQTTTAIQIHKYHAIDDNQTNKHTI